MGSVPNFLRRELRARTAPNYDAACFHAQQCAEKYLKALLQEAAIPFGKTHNLSLLLYLLEDRYPGESADKDVARQAVKMAEEVKQVVAGFWSKN